MSVQTAWGGLIMLVAIGVPVGLLLRFISRPVDPGTVPRDGYTVQVEADDPRLAGYRLRDPDGDER